MKRIVVMAVCILLGVVLNSGSSKAHKGLAEGDDWLKWSNETRLAYVTGYVWGFERGFTEGCQMAAELGSPARSSGLPGHQCMAKAPGYPQILTDYVTVITKYYESYPKDRRVPIRRVIERLSDDRNLTIQQIHQYLGEE